MELVLVRRWNSDEGPGQDPDEGGKFKSRLLAHTSEVKVRSQLDYLFVPVNLNSAQLHCNFMPE